MPEIPSNSRKFEVELSDGRIVTVESDHDPTPDEVLSAVGTAQPATQPPPDLLSPDGLQMPQLDDSLLPTHDPDYINRFGVPLEPPVPEPTWRTGFGAELKERAGDFARDYFGFIPSALRSAGAILSDDRQMEVDPLSGAIIPKPGTEPALPPESHPAYQAGTSLEGLMEEMFPSPQAPDLPREFVGGAGQMASMLTGGAAARGLGAGLGGATAAATGMGATMEFDDAFRRSRQRGDDPDTALSKSLGYATVASLIENRLGAGRILRQMFPSAVEGIKKLTAMGVSKKLLSNFAVQGAEEGAQRLAQNWIVEGEPSTEGVGREALVGGLVGGTVSAPTAAVVPPSIERTQNAIQPESTPVSRSVQQPEVAQKGAEQVPVAARGEETTQALTENEGFRIANTLEGKRKYTPAIRFSDGTIRTGPTHESIPGKRGTHGYVDKDGTFLSLTDVARREMESSAQAAEARVITEQSLAEMPPAEQAKVGHGPGIEYGITLTEADVPRLEAGYAKAGKEMVDAALKGDTSGQQAAFGRMNFYGGALQGATRGKHKAAATNYELFKQRREAEGRPIPEPVKGGELVEKAKEEKPVLEPEVEAVTALDPSTGSPISEPVKTIGGKTTIGSKLSDEQYAALEKDLTDTALSKPWSLGYAIVMPEAEAQFYFPNKAAAKKLLGNVRQGEVIETLGDMFQDIGEKTGVNLKSGQKGFKAYYKKPSELEAGAESSLQLKNPKLIREPYGYKFDEADLMYYIRGAIEQGHDGIILLSEASLPKDVLAKLDKIYNHPRYGFSERLDVEIERIIESNLKKADWQNPDNTVITFDRAVEGEVGPKSAKEVEVMSPDQALDLYSAGKISKSKLVDILNLGRPVGFFPRQSEALGLGEPALPPTVETVRAQREQEARQATTPVPPAPGEKTTPSRGTWFAGKNPRETATMMQERSNAFLQGKTDEQAIEDLTRLAGGDPNVQIDNQAANFAIKDLLVRVTRRAQAAKNALDANTAWSMVDRLAELSRRLGAEDARSLVSRNLAYKQIDWLMPVLAWRGIVKEKWRKALGLQEGQSLDEAVITPEEAKKRGLPELNGEQTRKIAELSKQAEQLPQGVRRNKVMEEMIRIMQSASSMSKLDLLRDIWYGSVLMRVGTMLNVLAGSYSTGASFAGLAAIDRAIQLRPIEAMKIIGQFIGGTIEGTLIADQIARKGAYHLLPDAEQRMVNLLSGKAGARFDNLEELLRRGNPVGILAYTRRFMAALDYIGALGTRDSQVLYGALTRGDQESLDALERRYNKAENKRAEQQARAEMGPKASRAEVLVRKREILEQGVADEIKENAIQVGRRAAQNADPRGIPGWFYKVASKLPFFIRAPAGLAFMRSAMNMVQNAVDYMPMFGAVSAIRGKIGTLPQDHPLHKFGLDIPVEERRMMLAAQMASLGIGAIAGAMFLGDKDEDDDDWEISGSWRGLTPQQKSQLMEMGERPNSIRFGKNSPWVSFKQMPFAPPLAIVGTMRDEERFHAKDWDGQSFMDKIVPAWLAGMLYIRDISSLSGVAAMFDANAWSTQETPSKLNAKINKLAAQTAGRAGAGYIPSVIKEADEFMDTSLYRPSKEEMSGWWIRNIPFARRSIGEGPVLNNFGEAVQLTPPPVKSWAGFGKDNDLYNTLGQLASRGIFLPEPGRTAKIVDDEGTYRDMTEDEWYKFIKTRGPIFKTSVLDNLEEIRNSEDKDAIEMLRNFSEKASAEARAEIWPMSQYRWMRKEP